MDIEIKGIKTQGSQVMPKRVKKKANRMQINENIWGWIFIIMPIFGAVVFALAPILLSFYINFTDWNGYTGIFESNLVGMKNFVDILGGIYSKEFYSGILNTLLIMLYVPISMFLGLLLALALNKNVPGTQVFRIIYYIPVISNVVAVTILFTQLFQNEGIINQFINMLGLPSVNWLLKPHPARVVLIVLIVWKSLGYIMLMYLAGLQNLSSSYYEAAKLDGANSVNLFFRITLPLLAPMTFYILVTSIIGAFQIFTEPTILFPFNAGKGPEKSTQTLMVLLYYNFTSVDKLGVASVIAWLLSLIIMLVTALQFYVYRKIDY